MASLYQRGKKGTWWIKYYVRGRPVFTSLKTTNARAAERVLKQIEGEHAGGSLVAPSKTPLPEFLEDCGRVIDVDPRAGSANTQEDVRNRWTRCHAAFPSGTLLHLCTGTQRPQRENAFQLPAERRPRLVRSVATWLRHGGKQLSPWLLAWVLLCTRDL